MYAGYNVLITCSSNSNIVSSRYVLYTIGPYTLPGVLLLGLRSTGQQKSLSHLR